MLRFPTVFLQTPCFHPPPCSSCRIFACELGVPISLALLDIIAHYGKSVTLYTLGMQDYFYFAPLKSAPYLTERFGVSCLVSLKEHRVTSKNFFPHVRTAGPIGSGRKFQTVHFFRCRGCARVAVAAKVGAHGVALGCASFVGSVGVRGQGRLAGPGSAQRCCFAGGRLAAQRPMVIPVQTVMTFLVHIAWSRVSACTDVVRCRRFVWR